MKPKYVALLVWAGCLSVGLMAGFALARSAQASVEPEARTKKGELLYQAPQKTVKPPPATTSPAAPKSGKVSTLRHKPATAHHKTKTGVPPTTIAPAAPANAGHPSAR